jgi:DNA-binding GntR family transcriptional regulator
MVTNRIATGAAVRPSTPDVIVDKLRRAILDGSIAGGTQLKQNDTAADFGVSVVPVREALQRLVAEGLAVLHPNRGVTVTQVSEKDFLEIAELRALLEPHALRLSAPHLSRGDFEHSESLLHQAAASDDPLVKAELHWGFHRSLYKKADRPRLIAQIGNLYSNINRYLLPVWSAVGLSPNWIDSHMRIVTAIRGQRIEEACELIVEQTFEASDRVREQLHSLIQK